MTVGDYVIPHEDVVHWVIYYYIIITKLPPHFLKTNKSEDDVSAIILENLPDTYILEGLNIVKIPTIIL